MMPGVVSLPHGYGHQVDGTRLRPRDDGRRRLDQRPDRPRAARRVAATPRSTAYRSPWPRPDEPCPAGGSGAEDPAYGVARGHRVARGERGLGGFLAQGRGPAEASRAPTGRTAAEAIDSEVTPIPTSAQASSGSAAASPQTPTDLPARRAGLGGDRDQLEHGRLPGVGQVGQVGGHPVGGHRVLGQVVGADREEVDDLEHPVRPAGRRWAPRPSPRPSARGRAPARRSRRPRPPSPPSAPSPRSRCRSRAAASAIASSWRSSRPGLPKDSRRPADAEGGVLLAGQRARTPAACRSRRRGCGPRRTVRAAGPAAAKALSTSP